MMVKHWYDILRILLKQNVKSNVKRQKSRLLIYDVYLKKYVSADELLIPSPTKDSTQQIDSWNKSKDYMVFDLLLKKFINPKLDLLSPPGVNSKIWDYNTISGCRYASTIKEFWERGTQNKTRHVPALPSTSNLRNEIQENVVGWAGQVTRKPESDPRPEQSKTLSALGQGGNPNKNSRKRKKSESANEKVRSKTYEKDLDRNGTLVSDGKSERKKKVLLAKDLNKKKDEPLQNKSKSKLWAKKANIKYNIFNKSLNDINKAEPENSTYQKEEIIQIKPARREKGTLFKKICSQMFSFGKSGGTDSGNDFNKVLNLQGKDNSSKDGMTQANNSQNEKYVFKSDTRSKQTDIKEHNKIKNNFQSSKTDKSDVENDNSKNKLVKSDQEYHKVTENLTHSKNEKESLKNSISERKLTNNFKELDKVAQHLSTSKNDNPVVKNNNSENELAKTHREQHHEVSPTLTSSKNENAIVKNIISDRKFDKITQHLSNSKNYNPVVKNNNSENELAKSNKEHHKVTQNLTSSKSEHAIIKNSTSENKLTESVKEHEVTHNLTCSKSEKSVIINNTLKDKLAKSDKEHNEITKNDNPTVQNNNSESKLTNNVIEHRKITQNWTSSKNEHAIMKNSTLENKLTESVKEHEVTHNLTCSKSEKSVIINNTLKDKLAKSDKEHNEITKNDNPTVQNNNSESKLTNNVKEHCKMTPNFTSCKNEHAIMKNSTLENKLSNSVKEHEVTLNLTSSKNEKSISINNTSKNELAKSDKDHHGITQNLLNTRNDNPIVKNNNSVSKLTNNVKEHDKTTPNLASSKNENSIEKDSTFENKLANSFKKQDKVNQNLVSVKNTGVKNQNNNSANRGSDKTEIKINEVIQDTSKTIKKESSREKFENIKVLNSNKVHKNKSKQNSPNLINVTNKTDVNMKNESGGPMKTDIKTIINKENKPTSNGKINNNEPYLINTKQTNLANFQKLTESQEKHQFAKINSLENQAFNFMFPPIKFKSKRSISNTEKNSNPGRKYENITKITANFQGPDQPTAYKKAITGSSISSTGDQVNYLIKSTQTQNRGSLTNVKVSEKLGSSVNQANQLEKQISAPNLSSLKKISPNSNDSKGKTTQNKTSKLLQKDKNGISSGLKKPDDDVESGLVSQNKIVTQLEENNSEGSSIKKHNIDSKDTEKLHAISAQGKFCDDLALDGELKQYNITNYRGFKILNSNSDRLVTKKPPPEKPKLKKDLEKSSSQSTCTDKKLGKPKSRKSSEFKESAVPEAKKLATNNKVLLQNKKLIQEKNKTVKSTTKVAEVKHINQKHDQEIVQNALSSNKNISVESVVNTNNLVKQDINEIHASKSNERNETTKETSALLPSEDTKRSNDTVGNKQDHRIRYHSNRRKLKKPISFKYTMKKSRKIKTTKEQEKIKYINHKKEKEITNLKLSKEQLKTNAKFVAITNGLNRTSKSVSKLQLNDEPQRSKSVPGVVKKATTTTKKQENEKHDFKSKSMETLVSSNIVHSGKQIKSLRKGKQNTSLRNMYKPKARPKATNMQRSKIKEPTSEVKSSSKSKSKSSNRTLKGINEKIRSQSLDKLTLKAPDQVRPVKIITKASLPSVNQSKLNKPPIKSKSNISNAIKLSRAVSKQRKGWTENDKEKGIDKKGIKYPPVLNKNIRLNKQQSQVDTSKKTYSQINNKNVLLKSIPPEVNKSQTNRVLTPQKELNSFKSNKRSITYNQESPGNLSKRTASPKMLKKVVGKKSSPELSIQMNNNKNKLKTQSYVNSDPKSVTKLRTSKNKGGPSDNLILKQKNITKEILGRPSRRKSENRPKNKKNPDSLKHLNELEVFEKDYSRKPNIYVKSEKNLDGKSTKKMLKPKNQTYDDGSESVLKNVANSEDTIHTTKNNSTTFKKDDEDIKSKHSSHSLKLIKSNQPHKSTENLNKKYKLEEKNEIHNPKIKTKQSITNVSGNNSIDNQESGAERTVSFKQVSSYKVQDMASSKDNEICNTSNSVQSFSDTDLSNNNLKKSVTGTLNATSRIEAETGEKTEEFFKISKENISVNESKASQHINKRDRTEIKSSIKQNKPEPSKSKYQNESKLKSRSLNDMTKVNQNEPPLAKDKNVKFDLNDNESVNCDLSIIHQIKKDVTKKSIALEKYIKRDIQHSEKENKEKETYNIQNCNFNEIDGVEYKNEKWSSNVKDERMLNDSKYSTNHAINKSKGTVSETKESDISKTTMQNSTQQTINTPETSYKQQPSSERNKPKVLTSRKQTLDSQKAAHKEPSSEGNTSNKLSITKQTVNSAKAAPNKSRSKIKTKEVQNSTTQAVNKPNHAHNNTTSKGMTIEELNSSKRTVNVTKIELKEPSGDKYILNKQNSTRQTVDIPKPAKKGQQISEIKTPKVLNSIRQTVNTPKAPFKEQQSSERNTPKVQHSTRQNENSLKEPHKESSIERNTSKVLIGLKKINIPDTTNEHSENVTLSKTFHSQPSSNKTENGLARKNNEPRSLKKDSAGNKKLPTKRYNIVGSLTTPKEKIKMENSISLNKIYSRENFNKESTVKSKPLKKLTRNNSPCRNEDKEVNQNKHVVMQNLKRPANMPDNKNNKTHYSAKITSNELRNSSKRDMYNNTLNNLNNDRINDTKGNLKTSENINASNHTKHTNSKNDLERNQFKTEVPLAEDSKRLVSNTKDENNMSIGNTDKFNSEKVTSKEEQNVKRDIIVNNDKNSLSGLKDKTVNVSTPNLKKCKTESAALSSRKEGENSKMDKSSIMKDKGFHISPEIRRKLSSLSKNVFLANEPNISQKTEETVCETKIDLSEINKSQFKIKDHTREKLRLMLGNIKLEGNNNYKNESKEPCKISSQTIEGENKINILHKVKNGMKREEKKTIPASLTLKDKNAQLTTSKNVEEDSRLIKLSKMFCPLKIKGIKELGNFVNFDENFNNGLRENMGGQEIQKNELNEQSIKNLEDSKIQTKINSSTKNDLLNLMDKNSTKHIMKNEKTEIKSAKRDLSQVDNKQSHGTPFVENAKKNIIRPKKMERNKVDSLKNSKT